MVRTRTTSQLTADDRSCIAAFLDSMQHDKGVRLNDHLLVDLLHGPRPGFVAVLADDGQRLTDYAQASTANNGFVVDAIGEHRQQLLASAVAALPIDESLTWWTAGDPATAKIAAELGLLADRRLLNMRRPLPIEATTDIAVRAFNPSRDESAWLQVNNAAFFGHGEQGGWDLDTLHQRLDEPWFDAEGFLLHDRDGRLAAFCWTKMHVVDDEIVGEIYVIGVHPDYHGQGLGRALTLAGLQYMSTVKATSAMLYVDAANTSAMRLYESLGFVVAHVDQSYLRPAQGATS
jgi:mycothiol synthase